MSRRAAWDAQRTALKLLELGPKKSETRFAADRRVYKQQVSALRKEWRRDDLLARRAAYVSARTQAAQRSSQRPEAWTQSTSDREAEREARAQRLASDRARVAKDQANARRMSETRVSERAAAEAESRRKWLQKMLHEYDVEGDEALSYFAGRRSWINDRNFDKKVQMLSINPHSPVNRWNQIARRMLVDEEQETINERLGGRRTSPLLTSLGAAYDSPPGGSPQTTVASGASDAAGAPAGVAAGGTSGSDFDGAQDTESPDMALSREDGDFLATIEKVMADLPPEAAKKEDGPKQD